MEFAIHTKIQHVTILDADNEAKAREQIKATFKDEYGIDLTDKEIVSITMRQRDRKEGEE